MKNLLVILAILAMGNIFAQEGLRGNYAIPDGAAVFVLPFTEVCFKARTTQFDIHQANESTGGGNCLPGDLGFIIERRERGAKNWSHALQICLENGMRLPDLFELQLACSNKTEWQVEDMNNDWEWASNKSYPSVNNHVGMAVAIFGYLDCGSASFDWVAHARKANYKNTFRCVR